MNGCGAHMAPLWTRAWGEAPARVVAQAWGVQRGANLRAAPPEWEQISCEKVKER